MTDALPLILAVLGVLALIVVDAVLSTKTRQAAGRKLGAGEMLKLAISNDADKQELIRLIRTSLIMRLLSLAGFAYILVILITLQAPA